MLSSRLSFRRLRVIASQGALAVLVLASETRPASAQATPQGFAVERFSSSAPGAGWMVLDDLRFSGRLGGAFSLTTGYARNPLRLSGGESSTDLSVVKHQAFFEVGGAVILDRLRLHFHASSPLYVEGESGAVRGYTFAPGYNKSTQQDCGSKRVCVDLGRNPDTIADPSVGLVARLVGTPRSAFRLGLSTEIVVPSGTRGDYLSDGTFRAIDKLLMAGEVAGLQVAAQTGVHLRPLNDSPVPGSPRGSELLYGVAVGRGIPLGALRGSGVVLGAEIYGASAFRGLFRSDTTGLEGLLSARWERFSPRSWLRLKAGVGAGLHAHFGAPDWRVLFGAELGGATD